MPQFSLFSHPDPDKLLLVQAGATPLARVYDGLRAAMPPYPESTELISCTDATSLDEETLSECSLLIDHVELAEEGLFEGDCLDIKQVLEQALRVDNLDLSEFEVALLLNGIIERRLVLDVADPKCALEEALRILAEEVTSNARMDVEFAWDKEEGAYIADDNLVLARISPIISNPAHAAPEISEWKVRVAPSVAPEGTVDEVGGPTFGRASRYTDLEQARAAATRAMRIVRITQLAPSLIGEGLETPLIEGEKPYGLTRINEKIALLFQVSSEEGIRFFISTSEAGDTKVYEDVSEPGAHLGIRYKGAVPELVSNDEVLHLLERENPPAPPTAQTDLRIETPLGTLCVSTYTDKTDTGFAAGCMINLSVEDKMVPVAMIEAEDALTASVWTSPASSDDPISMLVDLTKEG
ncbi:MAG: hypothetical protein E7001_00515 [Coriobacteriaceae bacterium]|nr:hypothetical protein [Coriobacteriaceae bacterium]